MIQWDERHAVFFTDPLQVEFLQDTAATSLDRCWKIPLSLGVHGFLLRKGFERVKSYIDFVDFKDCKRWYLESELRYSRDWLRELDLGFEVEGIDVAHIDAPCQFLLFSHLRFIERTSENIVAAMPQIERFHVIENRTALEHEFYFDSDVAAAVLCAVCERLGRPIDVTYMPQRPSYSFSQARPFMNAGPPTVPHSPENAHPSRIGFVLATVANARSILESLREVSSPIALFPSAWGPDQAIDPENEYTLSAADGHWSAQVAGRLNKLYSQFLRRRNRSTLPDAIIRNTRLDFQFAYILQRRWRAYANMIYHAKELVRQVPLDLFVHSDHFTAEGAILSHLYRRQGANILISLHSDFPCDSNWASWDRSDQALASTKTASARLRRLSGIRQVFSTGDPAARAYRSLLQASRQKPLADWKKAIAGNRQIVLILTNALELNCVPFVELKSHFESMSAVAKIAAALSDRVAVALRTKPGIFGEDPILYQQQSGLIPDILLAADYATFSECIDLADCIVGVNVATTGYYQILRSGPPLIHFQAADIVSLQPDLPSEAIINITDPQALGPIIEAALFDMEYRTSLLQKQRSFAASDYEATPSPSSDAVAAVAEALIRRGPLRSWWSRQSGAKMKPAAALVAPLDLSSMQILPSGEAGWVDDILYTFDGRGRVIGWAIDLSAGKTARAIHVFLNERWLAKGVSKFERPDVVALYGKPEFLWAGFSVDFRWHPPEVVNALQVYAEMHNGGFLPLSRSF